MSNFAQLLGTGYQVPLIPLPHEPAFCTFSSSTSLFLFNHQKALIGEFGNGNGSEGRTGGTFNQNVATIPATNSPTGYAATGHVSMHGHVHAALQPGLLAQNTATNGIYTNYQYSHAGTTVSGVHNSRSTGVWANKTKRDNLCFQRYTALENTGGGFTMCNTQISRFGWGAISIPVSQSPLLTSPNNSFTTARNYGLIGYNETTKWLVVADSNGTTTPTYYIYKNVSPPTYQNCLDDSFWSATNIVHGSRITSTAGTLPSAGEAYDYQHFKIIPLDDGNIRVVYKCVSATLRTFLLTGNSGLTSTTWTKGSEATISLTTSYHSGNGHLFDALTHFTSYDGKYTVCITQYQGYCTGMAAYMIRHTDGKYFKINFADSSSAFTSTMIGASTWLVGVGTNTDGTGLNVYQYNLQQIFDTGVAEATDVSTYYSAGYVDVPAASTSYGGLWQVVSPIPAYIKGAY